MTVLSKFQYKALSNVSQNLKIYLERTLIFVAAFSLGVIWHQQNWFPFPQLRVLKKQGDSPTINRSSQVVYTPDECLVYLIPYEKNMPLFSDRPYKENLGPQEFESSWLLRMPRHWSKKIKLKVDTPVEIYRLVSNENQVDFPSWGLMDISVMVDGISCKLNRVRRKLFEKGVYDLDPGGPVAASPILIKGSGEMSKFIKVINPSK